MDLKQSQVQDLVVEYFRQRPDAEIQPARGGMYRVILKSDVAQIDFGRDQFSLIFDAEGAYETPDSELVTANHPFLDIIRNDLERDPEADPRVADAYAVAQLLSPDGRLAVPQLVFSEDASRVSYRLSYHPTFVLTYRIVYEADERSENIIRLCYDAFSASSRPDLVLQLNRIYPVGGVPPATRLPDRLDLAPVLEAARRELEERVRSDVQVMGCELSAMLGSEKRRLTDYYARQMAAAGDDVTRQHLKATLEKDIDELERKLACRVRIQLLSVLRLWWPVVDYTLAMSGRSGDFEIQGIRYHSHTGQTTLFRCDVCGNKTAYDICIAGRHARCGGRCRSGLARCVTCGDSYCLEHGGPCGHCMEPICSADRRQCRYDHHSAQTYYCLRCLVESFEGQPLCKDCLEHCDRCGRPFPHDRMATCRLNGERICHGHSLSPDGMTCQECGQVACHEHGLYTHEKTWVCQDHAVTATCCGQTLGRSRVVSCCIGEREFLCPRHTVWCADCGQPVCEKHRYALENYRGKFVCAKCRHVCDQCPADKHYLPRDLDSCRICNATVCAKHRAVCAVDSAVVCQKDTRVSVARESLCQLHAGRCVQCDAKPGEYFHRTDSLHGCAVCRKLVCAQHRSTCQVCQATSVCKTHQEGLPACPSCGRSTCGAGECRADSHPCRSCGMAYCCHCVGPGDRCTTCDAVGGVAVSNDWLKFLQGAQGTLDSACAKTLEVLLQSPDQLMLRSARNRTYQVIVARFTPRWYQVWKTPQQIRIVTTHKGQIRKAMVEKAPT